MEKNENDGCTDIGCNLMLAALLLLIAALLLGSCSRHQYLIGVAEPRLGQRIDRDIAVLHFYVKRMETLQDVIAKDTSDYGAKLELVLYYMRFIEREKWTKRNVEIYLSPEYQNQQRQ